MSLTNDHWDAWITERLLREQEADKKLDKGLAKTRGKFSDDIKDGETVCKHNKRPFECKECRNESK